MLSDKKTKKLTKNQNNSEACLCLDFSSVISNCRGLIFGCKFAFWIMAVFKCQWFYTVNLLVFKNRNLVSLANNYLVFLLQPDMFSWVFFLRLFIFSFFFFIFLFSSWCFVCSFNISPPFPQLKFWGVGLFVCVSFSAVAFFPGNLFNLVCDAEFQPIPNFSLVLNVNFLVYPPHLADYPTQLKIKPVL